MATQKPISTISYNTLPFLKEKLDLWVSQHIIQAYQFIHHKGEDGDKDHTHLRIEPNKKLDPMDLLEELVEYPIGCEKPLGCRPFRPSKEEDWYLYVVHNPEYLKLKYNGGDKHEKIPYDWHEIQANDMYDTEVAWVRALAYLKHSTVNMATRIQNGERPLDLILQGENVYTVNQIMRAVSSNDYMRLQAELSEVRDMHFKLIQAIHNEGYEVEQIGDNLVLHKRFSKKKVIEDEDLLQSDI